MRIWQKRLLAICVIVKPALAQDVNPQIDIERDIARTQKEISKLDFEKLKTIKIPPIDLSGLNDKLALSTKDLGFMAFQGRGAGFAYSTGGGYDAGTRLLDERKYDEAIQRFDQVIASKSDRADGALYWKAYALNRTGRRDDALAAIATLRRDYPNSHWLNDAQALEVELKTNSGRPVSPADESNDDIKLIAINSLMNADPEQAIPLLAGLLKGNAAPKVKDRALFVLTQNRSPRAQQVLTEYAKGAGNPDLQIRAVRYVGMAGTAEAQQQLTSIYTASNDVAVKREIIRSLMTSQGIEPLFNLAKSEKDATLRGEAIRQLGILKATNQLSQLYTTESSQENKMQIIRALMVAGAPDKLLELAKNEKNATLRTEAIRNLSYTPGVTVETLTALYTADAEGQTKREVVNALHMRNDAKTLIALARKESDPSMKAYIVGRLAMLRHNKEAADYMVELLK